MYRPTTDRALKEGCQCHCSLKDLARCITAAVEALKYVMRPTRYIFVRLPQSWPIDWPGDFQAQIKLIRACVHYQ
jgi:hypothetical protein